MPPDRGVSERTQCADPVEEGQEMDHEQHRIHPHEREILRGRIAPEDLHGRLPRAQAGQEQGRDRAVLRDWEPACDNREGGMGHGPIRAGEKEEGWEELLKVVDLRDEARLRGLRRILREEGVAFHRRTQERGVPVQ